MTKKMVIKLSMNGDKTRSKALKIAVSIQGVKSVALGDKDKNQIEVIGEEGVDPVKLTRSLRRKMGKWPDGLSCLMPNSMMSYAELVSVANTDKKEEKKEEKNPIVWPCYSAPQYIYCEDPYRCSIL